VRGDADKPGDRVPCPSWIVSAGAGNLRLLVECDPPWPTTVLSAAQLVAEIDRHHLAGRDDEAAEAATELEGLLTLIAAEGVEARLSS
jgi:hypothetical protein